MILALLDRAPMRTFGIACALGLHRTRALSFLRTLEALGLIVGLPANDQEGSVGRAGLEWSITRTGREWPGGYVPARDRS